MNETPIREFATIELNDDDVTQINMQAMDFVATEKWRGQIDGKIVRVHYSCTAENSKALNKATLERELLEDGAFMVWEILPDKIDEFANRTQLENATDPEANLIKYLEEKQVPQERIQELVLKARPIIAEAEASMKYTTLHKVCRYISDKKIKYDHDYFDYIGWIEKMGYHMTNEFNLFPKNFVNVHDEMSKQYVKFKDKQAREDAKRFNQTLKKLRKETKDVEAMNLNIEGLFIRLPNRLEELKKEGEALHHCVGTYMERVRKGETMIFFIRRKEEPEKPYYTLEWHGKVVQCRGSHNCDMTPEVKAFVQIFQEKMTEYASEPPKHRKAG